MRYRHERCERTKRVQAEQESRMETKIAPGQRHGKHARRRCLLLGDRRICVSLRGTSEQGGRRGHTEGAEGKEEGVRGGEDAPERN